jgi:hypothetical protein
MKAKNLNLKSNEIKLESFSNKYYSSNQFVVIFNRNRFPFQKFSHGFKLQGSIAPNMHVSGLIIDDEDEPI